MNGTKEDKYGWKKEYKDGEEGRNDACLSKYYHKQVIMAKLVCMYVYTCM